MCGGVCCHKKHPSVPQTEAFGEPRGLLRTRSCEFKSGNTNSYKRFSHNLDKVNKKAKREFCSKLGDLQGNDQTAFGVL